MSWDRAFDVMAEQFKKEMREKGATASGMFGSGQWTIWEGCAAAKLMKTGFRTNNPDPNARHCMASVVAGFMHSFGMDESGAFHLAGARPSGCDSGDYLRRNAGAD